MMLHARLTKVPDIQSCGTFSISRSKENKRRRIRRIKCLVCGARNGHRLEMILESTSVKPTFQKSVADLGFPRDEGTYL